MKNRMLLLFLKDKRDLTLGYFLSNALIILFYYLSVRETVEIVYPVIISTFIYLIIITIEGVKYYSFNKTIMINVHNHEFDLKALTAEQKRVRQCIIDIHTKYFAEIDFLKNENEKKQNMLTQWIHNIKTPISVIDLMLQKAKENGDIDPSLLEELIVENNKTIEQLENLLTILRLDNFSKDYMLEAVNITDQVYKLINQRKNQFVYNKVFPKFLTEKKEFIVITDQKWNEIMLDQIISNAIKYSNATDQSKHVYFSIIQEEKWTKLIIRDEGIGISEYDKQRIFEPFVTGDNGRIIHNSTGIGLYICQLIAEQLGIQISIESVKGKGTSVMVSYLSKL